MNSGLDVPQQESPKANNDGKENFKNWVRLLLILRLLKNDDLNNFHCYLNLYEFEDFQDFVISLTKKSGHIYNYAIHITDETDRTEVKVADLMLSSTKCSLRDLFDKVENIITGNKMLKNRLFGKSISNDFNGFVVYTKWSLENKLECEQSETSIMLHNLLDTKDGISSFCHKRDGSQHLFYLFTNKDNLEQTKRNIQRMIKEIARPTQLKSEQLYNIPEEFCAFLRSECDTNRNMLLTKDFLLNKIVASILKPYVWDFHIQQREGSDFQFCRDLKSKFRVVIENDIIVKEYVQSFVSNIVFNEIKSFNAEINDINEEYKLMCITGKAPLIVCLNDERLIKQILEMLRLTKPTIKIIFLINKENLETLLSLDMCASLKDFSEDTKHEVKAKAMLQILPTVLYNKLYSKGSEFVKIKDIIYILLKSVALVKNYIKPSLDIIWVKPEAIAQLSDFFIIQCLSDIEEDLFDFFNNYNISIDKCNIHRWPIKTNISFKIILVSSAKEAREVKNILNVNVIHYLKFVSGAGFKWIYSYGTNQNIKKYATKNGFIDLNRIDTMEMLSENLGSEIRIISGVSGIGKSTFLNYLSNVIGFNCLVAQISLKNFTPSVEECLKKELDFYAKNKNKRVILIDGFDEVRQEFENEILQIIESILKLGCVVYLTTRPNYETILETHFKTFSISFRALTDKQQRLYLVNNITSSNYRTDLVADVHSDVLSIPFHAKMLCNFIQRNKDLTTRTSLSEKHNVMWLCKYFFEHNLEKYFQNDSDNKTMCISEYKRLRFLYACKEVFLDHDNKTDIEIQKLSKPRLMNALKQEKILKEEHPGKFSYVHRIFAEYCVAQWLSENIDTTLIKKLFQIKYVYIRHYFDQLLATDCPLHLSIINNKFDDAIQAVLEDAEAVYKLDKGGRSALHITCSWSSHYKQTFVGQKLYLTVFLKDGLKSNCDTLFKYSEIDYAILTGSLAIADELCSKMQDVKAFSGHFDSSGLKKYFLLELLSRKYSILNSTNNNDNCTPIHVAFLSDVDDTEKLSRLLQGNYCLSEKDQYNQTVLHYAILYKNQNIINLVLNELPILRFDKHYMLKQLTEQIKYDQEIEKLLDKDLQGRTALHYAAARGLLGIVQRFVDGNADVSIKEENGWNPLHWASYYGHSNVVKLLISDKDECINSTDFLKRTPLLLAVEKGHAEVVKILLDSKADANIANTKTLTALCIAVLNSNIEVTEMLLKYGANVEHRTNSHFTPLLLSVHVDCIEIVQLLLDYNVDVFAKNNQNRTALFFAVEHGYTAIVKLLLEKAKELNPNKFLLLKAINLNYLDIALLLVNYSTSDEMRANYDSKKLLSLINSDDQMLISAIVEKYKL